MKRLFALLIFIPLPAFGLGPSLADDMTSATITAPEPYFSEEETAHIGVEECQRYLDDNVRIDAAFEPTFDPTTASLVDGYYYFETTRNATGQLACEDGLCEEIDSTAITTTTDSIVISLEFSKLVGDDGASCDGFDNEYFIRVTTKDPLDENLIENSDVKLVVDAIRPGAPTELTASATESGIDVSFTGVTDNDAEKYYVFYSTTAFAAGDIDPSSASRTAVADDLSTEGSISVQLIADETYYIAVATRDEAGNYSPLSNVVTTAAVETQDFWEAYQEAGGTETGGCATSSPNRGGFLLFLFALVLVPRRRRRFALVAVALMTIFASTSLYAETPKYGAFEFKLGGYYPAIDSEFGGTGPYESVFGANNTIMGEFEVDGYFWQKYVKFGLGAHVGFAAHKGDALSEDPNSDATDSTRITFFPFRASAVLRLDYFAEHFGIPLVPNGKVGLDFYRWRVADGNRETAESGGNAGSGWKSGWHASFGLQLLLDFFAPSMASGMDLHFGVNNSYFFAEYLTTKIDGFGAEGFDLSDNQWMFGLAFEF